MFMIEFVNSKVPLFPKTRLAPTADRRTMVDENAALISRSRMNIIEQQYRFDRSIVDFLLLERLKDFLIVPLPARTLRWKCLQCLEEYCFSVSQTITFPVIVTSSIENDLSLVYWTCRIVDPMGYQN